MKQGAVVNRIVMLLFFLAILLYLGGAAYRGLRDPYPTVQTYAYAVEDTVEATGYLVREERVLTGTVENSGIVRLTPSEGEKVAAGSTVALLYADQLSLERSERLQVLENEVSQLTAAIAAAGDAGASDHLGANVTDALVALRASVEAGDFTALENQSTVFKSAVYQQAQRYGEAGDLSAAVATANAEIASLRAQTAQNVGRVTVDRSGVFSGQVDGYEGVLTPETLEDLTPADLRAMDARAASVNVSCLGKLITDSTWYFICPMDAADARRLVVGQSVPIRFSRDWAGEVDMTVEHISDAQDGQVAVVLSSNRFLSNTTLLRRQTVELIFDRLSGLRVPTAAVRMEEGQSVVYVQVSTFAEKKPVTILAQGEDYTLVAPVVAEDATETQKKLTLRAGDDVIISTGPIWDGMVLE